MSIHKNQKNEVSMFSPEQNELIKKQLCKNISDDELHFFAAVCKKTGLDPFMKQIYAVKRGDAMTIQTSIDGYRLIAERTGRYAPGRESTHVYKGDRLFSSTSYVKKQTKDGTWHEVSVTCLFDEYKPNYKSQFWDTKPTVMLDKCAESLALRKAFPNELSGLYTSEEMDQAQNSQVKSPTIVSETQAEELQVKSPTIVSETQAEELQELLDKCPSEDQDKMNAYLQGKGINSFYMLPLECYDPIKKRLLAKVSELEVKGE
jgi:phage recombination protein Bet